MKAIAIVGFSRSGKTELICRLLPWFAEQGLKVAVLKHSHKTGLGDEHKDTARFRRAGAGVVGLAAPGVLQITHTCPGDPSFSQALAAVAPQADLILVEGYKAGPLPKVAVLGADASQVPAYPHTVALVSSRPVASPLPVFQPHQISELGRFILMHLGCP